MMFPPPRGEFSISHTGGILSRKKAQTKSAPRTSDLDQARNDLFGHIHRCGVLRATEEQQVEWMNDTIEYLGEVYPSLTEQEMEELKTIGLRFCRPVIVNGAQDTAAVNEAEGTDELATEEASAA